MKSFAGGQFHSEGSKNGDGKPYLAHRACAVGMVKPIGPKDAHYTSDIARGPPRAEN